MKKWLVAVVLVISGLGLAAPAVAEPPEQILNNTITAVVSETGRIDFTERITWDFAGLEKHGIFLQLPLLDDLGDGRQQNYDLEVTGVWVDDENAPYSTSIVDEFLELKIGDPDVLVSGVHEYRIEYTISNALVRVTADDVAVDPRLTVGDVSLYWDFVGDGWDVPMSAVGASVSAPDAPIAANCTYGPTGSTEQCTSVAAGSTTSYRVENLGTAQFVTLSLQFPAGAFTSIPEPNITEYTGDPLGHEDTSASEFASGLPYGVGLGLLLFAGIVGVGQLRRNSTKTARVTEAVRFEPPPGVTPAELQAAWKGQVDARGFTASLLDFATRGLLTLELFDPGILSGDRLRIKWLGVEKPLAGWEQTLLQGAFLGRSEREFGGYERATGDAVKSVSTQLVAEAHASGRRNPRALLGKLPFIVLAAVLFFGGFLFFIFTPTPLAIGVLVPAMFLALVAALVAALRVPKVETESSAEFLSAVLGFRKLMDTDSAAARREFAQRSGLTAAAVFATMLPFAVVLEVDEAWGAAFPDLTPDDLMPFGLGYVGVGGVHHLVDTSVKSVGQATTAPSRSGSGAGGGSAGGGGGGGGGGSW